MKRKKGDVVTSTHFFEYSESLGRTHVNTTLLIRCLFHCASVAFAFDLALVASGISYIHLNAHML